MKSSIFALLLLSVSLISSSCEKTCDPAIPDSVKNFDLSINSTTQEKCGIYHAEANSGASPAIAVTFKCSVNPDSNYPYGKLRIELTNYKGTGRIPILPMLPTTDQLLKPYCTVTFIGTSNDPNMYAYQVLTGEVIINKIDDEFDITLKGCSGDKRSSGGNAPASVLFNGNMRIKL